MRKRGLALALICLPVACSSFGSGPADSAVVDAAVVDGATDVALADVALVDVALVDGSVDGADAATVDAGDASVGGDDAADEGAVARRVGRVFLTAQTYAPNFSAGGTIDAQAGADAACATSASLAGVTRTSWIAWLSTSMASAINRLPTNVSWYLMDRTTLVFKFRSMIPSGPAAPIDRDANGTLYLFRPEDGYVWTGTTGAGTVATGLHCSDWSVVGTNQGAAGRFDQISGGTWTHAALQVCATGLYHLYCFEDPP